MILLAAVRPNVMLVGEISPVMASLQDTADCTHFASVGEAITYLAEASSPPELIVLMQARPGEIGDADVVRLQSVAPLAGMIGVLGSWCEGEPRTGRPWPGVERCYEHEWPLRWAEEVDRRARGEMPRWALPVTASAEERLLSRSLSIGKANGTVIVVVAQSREAADGLSDACRAGGFRVQSSDVSAALWDTTKDAAKDARQVAAMKTRFAGAPLLALVSFPRPSECEQMLAAGIDAVLAKPFLLDELLAEIERRAHSMSNSSVRKISRRHDGS